MSKNLWKQKMHVKSTKSFKTKKSFGFKVITPKRFEWYHFHEFWIILKKWAENVVITAQLPYKSRYQKMNYLTRLSTPIYISSKNFRILSQTYRSLDHFEDVQNPQYFLVPRNLRKNKKYCVRVIWEKQSKIEILDQSKSEKDKTL